jgi:serine phosphatase RsbU (regulator of sigma subunit)
MATSVEVGGDYYDFKELENGGFAAALGDATGHGTRAGIIVSSVKSYFQILAGVQRPDKVLDSISTGIRQMQLQRAYMGLAILEYRNGGFCYASAGMPPLLVYRSQTNTVETITIASLFLGTQFREPYQEQEVLLSSGDVIVMLSDGFTETRNPTGQMLPAEAIAESILDNALLGSRAIVSGLVALQTLFGQQEFLHDDSTALVIRMW